MVPSDSCTGSSESLELCRSGVPQQYRNVQVCSGGWVGVNVVQPSGTDQGLDKMLDRPRDSKGRGRSRGRNCRALADEDREIVAPGTIGGDKWLDEVFPGRSGAAACERSDTRKYPRWLPAPWKDSPGMQRLMRASQLGKGIGPKRSTCEPGSDETSLGAWQKQRMVKSQHCKG